MHCLQFPHSPSMSTMFIINLRDSTAVEGKVSPRASVSMTLNSSSVSWATKSGINKTCTWRSRTSEVTTKVEDETSLASEPLKNVYDINSLSLENVKLYLHYVVSLTNWPEEVIPIEIWLGLSTVLVVLAEPVAPLDQTKNYKGKKNSWTSLPCQVYLRFKMVPLRTGEQGIKGSDNIAMLLR